MKNKNLQGGFAPMLIIAIIAVLVVGGGAYVATKNKQAKNVELEDNLDTQANANADANANANANLGVNAKNSLRSLLGLGQSTKCTFSNTVADVSSSGTIYLGADGDMRGEFESKVGTQAAVSSNMIVKDGVTFTWSGTQGVKMTTAGADASAQAQANKYVDMDAQMDYDCSAWTRDESKFTIPTGVNFVDLESMMRGSVLPSGVNWDGTIKGKTQ